MQIPDSDPRNNNRAPAEKPPMSFQTLVDQLRPQLEKIPEGNKIPLLPPSPEVLEEVQQYVRTALLLPLSESLPPSVQVGQLFLDRSMIRFGRIGLHEKMPVFAFIYQFVPKKLDCVLVYPKDGVEIEMIAKIVFWGQTPSLPLKYVSTDILPAKAFFDLQTFYLCDLADAPALKILEDTVWRNATTQILAAERLQKAAEARAKDLDSRLSAETEQRVEAEESLDSESHRARFWKHLALSVIVVGCLLGAVVVFCWLRLSS